MQLLGEGRQDKIDQTFVAAIGDAQYLLHKLVSGAFQTGVGKDAKIITELSQVSVFGPDVQKEVAEWLSRQGHHKAMQEKVSADIHEQSMQRPGDIDSRLSLLEQAAPGIKGDILQLIDAMLIKRGLVPAASEPMVSGQTGGTMREATQQEINEMVKSGMQIDPANPPKVFDPSGAFPATSSDKQGAMDLLREEQNSHNASEPESDDVLGMADELSDDDEGEFAGVGAGQEAAEPRTKRAYRRRAKR